VAREGTDAESRHRSPAPTLPPGRLLEASSPRRSGLDELAPSGLEQRIRDLPSLVPVQHGFHTIDAHVRRSAQP
jgi:hypothetical protein